MHHLWCANRLLFINITAYNSRSLSVLHDTSARARAHQHLIRKRHGVQQKKCLWSSETTGLYAHHAACVTAGTAPQNGVEIPTDAAVSVERHSRGGAIKARDILCPFYHSVERHTRFALHAVPLANWMLVSTRACTCRCNPWDSGCRHGAARHTLDGRVRRNAKGNVSFASPLSDRMSVT